MLPARSKEPPFALYHGQVHSGPRPQPPTTTLTPDHNPHPPKPRHARAPTHIQHARPKDIMYFAQQHATHAFELPPNPHLTREQHVMWKEQVGALPQEKVRAAYETLERETGLARDEL